MTWNSAFPSSPLSRSALRGDTDLSAIASVSAGAAPPLRLPSQDSLTETGRMVVQSGITRTRESPIGHQHPPNGWTASSPPSIGELRGREMATEEAESAASKGLYAVRRAPGLRAQQLAAERFPHEGVTNQSGGRPSALSALRSPSSPLPRSPTSPQASSMRSAALGAARRRTSAPHAHGLTGVGGGEMMTSPSLGSLIGSFEESLLSGRMSGLPSRSLRFDAELGVLGLGRCKPSLRCPPHLNLSFPAHFYTLEGAAQLEGRAAPASPYVGTVDLEGHFLHELLADQLCEGLGIGSGGGGGGGDLGGPALRSTTSDTTATALRAAPHLQRPEELDGDDALRQTSANHSSAREGGANANARNFPGYRIPPRGQIQLVIKNPNLTAVKLFLVPYDLTDMPPGTKTFIRQKSLATAGPSSSTQVTSSPISPSLISPLGATDRALDAKAGSAAAASERSNMPMPPLLASPSVPVPPTASSSVPSTSVAPPSMQPAVSAPSRPPAPRPSPRETLRYAIHLQFCSPPLTAPRASVRGRRPDGRRRAIGSEEERAGSPSVLSPSPTPQACADDARDGSVAAKSTQKYYLYKSIRVVFAARVPDKLETLKVVTETPGGQNRHPDMVYAPYSGPGEQWREAKRSVRGRWRADRQRQRQPHVDLCGCGRSIGVGSAVATHASGADGRSESESAAGEPANAGAVADEDDVYGAFSVVEAASGVQSDPNGENWPPRRPSHGQGRESSPAERRSSEIDIPRRPGQPHLPLPSQHTTSPPLAGAMPPPGGPSATTIQTAASPHLPADGADEQALLDAWHSTLLRSRGGATSPRPPSPETPRTALAAGVASRDSSTVWQPRPTKAAPSSTSGARLCGQTSFFNGSGHDANSYSGGAGRSSSAAAASGQGPVRFAAGNAGVTAAGVADAQVLTSGARAAAVGAALSTVPHVGEHAAKADDGPSLIVGSAGRIPDSGWNLRCPDPPPVKRPTHALMRRVSSQSSSASSAGSGGPQDGGGVSMPSSTISLAAVEVRPPIHGASVGASSSLGRLHAQHTGESSGGGAGVERPYRSTDTGWLRWRGRGSRRAAGDDAS